MQSVDLEDGPIEFVGALDLDRSDAGISPRRLPAWTRPQIADPFLDGMVAMASGVRLTFETTSSTIEIDLAATSFRRLGTETRPQVFQLIVDDADPIDVAATNVSAFVLDPVDPTNVGFEEGGSETIRFDGLGNHVKRCEVWLPQTSTIRFKAMRIDDKSMIRPTTKPASALTRSPRAVGKCAIREPSTSRTETWGHRRH